MINNIINMSSSEKSTYNLQSIISYINKFEMTTELLQALLEVTIFEIKKQNNIISILFK